MRMYFLHCASCNIRLCAPAQWLVCTEMQLALQPKFQCAVPFSPVTGPRILIKDASENKMLLKAAAQTLMKLTGLELLVLVTCSAMIAARCCQSCHDSS